MRNEQTHRGLGDCGKGLTDETSLHSVNSYATTESDKSNRTTSLLLSSSKIKSLDLMVMGSTNTAITKTNKKRQAEY